MARSAALFGVSLLLIGGFSAATFADSKRREVPILSDDFQGQCETAVIFQKTPLMQQMIDESANKQMLLFSEALVARPVPKQDVPAYLEYVSKHRDYRSYHVLFALRRDHRAYYNTISKEIRAAILSSALGEVGLLNDWGGLSLRPEDLLKEETVQALVEIGPATIPYLSPLLNDLTAATFEGSEEATESEECQYRRADWACRFITLILKRPYNYSDDPKERDKEIAILKKKLASRPLPTQK